jgi:hypothetical protein
VLEGGWFVSQLHGELGLFKAEESLENAYLGSRLAGGITYGLFVEVLLKIPINLFCPVLFVTFRFSWIESISWFFQETAQLSGRALVTTYPLMSSFLLFLSRPVPIRRHVRLDSTTDKTVGDSSTRPDIVSLFHRFVGHRQYLPLRCTPSP